MSPDDRRSPVVLAPRATGARSGRRGARWRSGVLALALTAAGALAVGGCAELRPLHGTVYEPPSAAPALPLVRADGRPFDLAGERGKVVAVFFGYANCPDVCPTTLADLARMANGLPEGTRERFRVVFVSVDPARDTPAVADAYARRFQPSFVGVTADEARVAAAARAYGVAAAPLPTGTSSSPVDSAARGEHAGHPAPSAAASGGYDVMHAGSIFLVDREGRLRTVLSAGTPMADVAADVRKLAG